VLEELNSATVKPQKIVLTIPESARHPAETSPSPPLLASDENF